MCVYAQNALKQYFFFNLKFNNRTINTANIRGDVNSKSKCIIDVSRPKNATGCISYSGPSKIHGHCVGVGIP